MSDIRPGRRRRGGVLVLAAGLAAIALGQLIAPIAAPPLYDGVVVVEPYRWLDPAPAGQKGGAKGATATIKVKDGANPLVAIATPEQPPQAQVFAPPSSLTLAPGATSLDLSIQPMPTEGAPADGHIVGNVYRILIVDQNGQAVTAPASALVSVVIRGPGTIADATTEQFVDGSWKPLKTSSAGFASTFLAVVTSFGDFALVAPGPGPSSAASAAPASSPTTAASSPAASVSVPATGPGTVASATPAPTAGSSSGDAGGSSTPIVPIVIAVVVLGGIVVVLANRRRPPPSPPTGYQGARRR